MPSYSDYLFGAIIQEFNSLFNVEYCDNMYKNLIFYTDSRTALKQNNYSLRTSEEGFSLHKNKEFFVDMKMGDFSAPFLNAWIQMEESDLIQFPIGFEKANPREMQGRLSQYSGRFAEEIVSLGMTPQQADAGAVEIFMSDEIVTDGDNSIFKVDPRSVKVMPKVDFESNGKVTFEDDSEDESETDSEDDQDDADDKVAPAQKVAAKLEKKNGPEPFYYVISMEKRGKRLEKLPKIWRKKIEEDGLSWEFVDGHLYVSNTKGASFGFPPAPHHLCGLPRLALSLNDWENVVTPPVTEENDNKGSSTTTILDGEWEELIEQFMADPCWTKFELFRDSEKVFDAFEEVKKDKRYKMGSNNKPISADVRKGMEKEENAIEWTKFAEVLKAKARPNDNKGLMVLLFKLRLYVAETTDGKVYTTRQ